MFEVKQHETLESRDSHTSLLPTCTRTLLDASCCMPLPRKLVACIETWLRQICSYLVCVCVCVSDTPACWTKTKWGFSGASNNLPNYIELSLHDEKRQSCSEVALEGILLESGCSTARPLQQACGSSWSQMNKLAAIQNADASGMMWGTCFSLIGIPYLPNWINSIVCQVGHQVIKYVTNTLNATLEKISWLYTSKIDVGRPSSQTFWHVARCGQTMATLSLGLLSPPT